MACIFTYEPNEILERAIFRSDYRVSSLAVLYQNKQLASMSKPRTASPSDVADEECALLAPDLALVREDAPRRVPSLRQVFNA
ncbi:MAG: hypothetical protein CL946_03945 [Ectothiorhodospiraceae bacterium]|nr:hypothetical protein [Ectothiorhodospiraceae bacterium]